MDKQLLVMIADGVFSIGGLFATHYLAPDALNLYAGVVAVLQPIVIYYIKAEKDKAIARLTAIDVDDVNLLFKLLGEQGDEIDDLTAKLAAKPE